MVLVSAGIAVREGRMMLCQRKADAFNALKWEFPGGKLEAGESPQQALERELWEELRILTRTGRVYDTVHRFEHGSELLILYYFTEILSGEPQTADCNAVAWVEPRQLMDYDLAPADAQVARRLAREWPVNAK